MHCAFRRLIVCALSLTYLISPACAAADSVTLAENGKALRPIVIAKDASARQRAAAQTLADYLGKISGAKFEVLEGDGTSGVALGTPNQYPQFAKENLWDVADVTRHEDYLLRSHKDGLHLIGASDLAIEDAVWDLLHRLGHRQFFPGAVWECIPKESTLAIAVDAKEHPAYYARRIWYGFGAGPWAPNTYGDWCARNRAGSGIELSTGHAYDGILKRNKAEFDKHPEYLGLVNGKRSSTKFCISNPGLRSLIVNDAIAHFKKSPDSQSISVDPSDGGNWCECEACKTLGSVSDRAVTLANAVASGVEAAGYKGKFVGMYAYNFHSPPPSTRVHPNVVISVATAFIKGGNTFDEILSGWAEKGAALGIREYYSVNTWDRDMPGHARGGNLEYLARTIPEFNAKGARFLSAESSNNWGPNGLGYYLAARIMWNPAEAKNIDALVEDFLTRAFGPAKEPMREFYKQIDGSKPHLVFSNQLGQMFRSLDEARRLAATPDIRARVDDLILYAHYAELYDRYSHEKDAARQTAFEALIKHAFRMRKTQMVHTYALYRDLASRDKTVHIPPEATWKTPEAKNPWASSEPFSNDELARFLADGIKNYPLSKLDFEPVNFSDELVGAGKLKLPETPAGQFGAARGKQTFYTYVEKAPATLELQITGGLIEHYRDRGNVRIELWKIGGASVTGERETLAAQDRSVPPDGNEHAVSLTIKEPGLYKLTLNDGNDRTLLKWPSALPVTLKSAANDSMNGAYSDLWLLYFYVPKGTKTIGLFGGDSGEVRDSKGRTVFWLNGRAPNYYSAAVPDGEDGKLWSLKYGRGAVRLLTVPPYFAPSATSLLLPAEVITKDAAKE